MRQYENNIDKVMPIRNFGEYNGKEMKFCKLKKIWECDGMNYFLELYSDDMELLGSRWVTRLMYRYHVLNKEYK